MKEIICTPRAHCTYACRFYRRYIIIYYVGIVLYLEIFEKNYRCVDSTIAAERQDPGIDFSFNVESNT